MRSYYTSFMWFGVVLLGDIGLLLTYTIGYGCLEHPPASGICVLQNVHLWAVVFIVLEVVVGVILGRCACAGTPIYSGVWCALHGGCMTVLLCLYGCLCVWAWWVAMCVAAGFAGIVVAFGARGWGWRCGLRWWFRGGCGWAVQVVVLVVARSMVIWCAIIRVHLRLAYIGDISHVVYGTVRVVFGACALYMVAVCISLVRYLVVGCACLFWGLTVGLLVRLRAFVFSGGLPGALVVYCGASSCDFVGAVACCS